MNYLKIKKTADYNKLFKRGKRVYSPAVTLIYFPSAQTGMGIALTKKHGKAVKRNRLKRLLREAFNKNCHLLKQNYSIILLPKIAEEYNYGEIEKSVVSCLLKVNKCACSNN